MSVLLDHGSASTHAVITAGDLKLSSDAAGQVAAARANTIKSAGKGVFEATLVNPIIFGQADVGVTNKVTPSTTSLLGTMTIDRNGSVQINNVFIGFVARTTPVMIVVDLTNHLLWVKDTGGQWNNNGGDPCAGTGGFDISSIDATGLYPFALIDDPSRSATFNFGATAFINTQPPCTTAWEPPASPTLNIRQLARVSQFRQTLRAALGPLPAHMQLSVTEDADTVSAMRLSPNDGFTFSITEDSDDAVEVLAVVAVPVDVDNGERIYVLHEDGVLVPADKFTSRIIISLEPTIPALPFTEH